MFIYVLAVREPKPDLSNRATIRRLLGYNFPEYWRVADTEPTKSGFYWAIDGEMSDEWLAKMKATPFATDGKRWSLVVNDKNGTHNSTVLVRCAKGCCIGVEVILDGSASYKLEEVR